MTQPNLSLRCCWTMIRRVKHCLAHGQKRHTWPVEWNHGISIRPLSQGSSLPKLEVEECPRLPRNVQKLNVGTEDGILDEAVYWITLISRDYDSATKICCDPKVQQLSSTKLQTCRPTSKWIAFDNRICGRGLYGAWVYFASAGFKSHQNIMKLYKQLFATESNFRNLKRLVVKLPQSCEDDFGIRSRNHKTEHLKDGPTDFGSRWHVVTTSKF